MRYYIQHYFNPDFDHKQLKGITDSKGRINLRNLNYVQNVVKGQILAEVLPFDDTTVPVPEKRFTRDNPNLPVGSNTEIDPENPNRLIASINGYVFYHDKKITVKHLLNIRRNIDLHTGNIAFVGDIAVFGDVNSQFELRAANVVVKGIIEGAFIRTNGSIVGEGGFKGSSEGKLIAEKDVRVAFAETGYIRAMGKIVVDGSCLHCNMLSNKDIVVRGRLAGGTARAMRRIYVSSRIGLNSNIPTNIILGQNPLIHHLISKCEIGLGRLAKKQERYNTLRDLHGPNDEQFEKACRLVDKKIQIFNKEQIELKHLLYKDIDFEECLLIVPGEILPGVTVTIGDVSIKIQKPEQNVHLRRVGDEIVIRSPAVLESY